MGYMGYSLWIDKTWNSKRSADEDQCLLGCHTLLEIMYFMDFVHRHVLQSPWGRWLQMWYSIVGILQNYTVNSWNIWYFSLTWDNPSGRTLDLSSIQPLTERTTRDLPLEGGGGGVKAAGASGWQPCHLHLPTVWNSWMPQPPGALGAYLGLYL
jgi:hypothetical protein